MHGNPILFSSERHGDALRSTEALAAADLGLNPIQRNRPMIHTDPPRHQPLRKTISHNFTPRAIARLEDQLRRYTVSCLDELSDRRDIDFVVDVAHRVPTAIAFSLMDVPEKDWGRLAELEHMTVTGTDPEFTHGQSAQEARTAAGIEMVTYFSQLVEQRRHDPGEDLLSQMLGAEVLGAPVPWQQVVSEAALLLAGGLDTTRAAASAGAVLPLIEHPEHRRDLRDDPSLLSTAVDEFVRWASPITSKGADGHRGHRVGRSETAPGGPGGSVVTLVQPRRGPVRASLPLRHSSQEQPPPRFRPRRALLPRSPSGPAQKKVEFEEIVTRRFTSIEAGAVGGGGGGSSTYRCI